jgi:2-amino-4-hydroxy-6-hydroxymethyldihydropteridine diphosphokinase
MSTFFLSLGSNIRPEKNIPVCLERLKKKFHVKQISSIYETKPVGAAKGGNFWNLAAAIETDLDQETLSRELRQIENALGRKRDPRDKYAPRTIDIDLLPQPGYQKQAFIMIPLAEIAPKEIDPESGRSIADLANTLPKTSLYKVSF